MYKKRPLGACNQGLVACSIRCMSSNASPREAPHVSGEGRKVAQTAGRSGMSKSAHRLSPVRCGHRTPAGLPFSIRGIGELIDIAMQHAPHLLQSITVL